VYQFCNITKGFMQLGKQVYQEAHIQFSCWTKLYIFLVSLSYIVKLVMTRKTWKLH